MRLLLVPVALLMLSVSVNGMKKPKTGWNSACRKDPAGCHLHRGTFPAKMGGVKRYKSMFQDDHQPAALYSNMDLTTPQYLALQKLETDTFSPPRIYTVSMTSALCAYIRSV